MTAKAACFLAAALAATPVLANDSVYSDVSRDKCTIVEEVEGIFMSMTCPGPDGYPAHFKESDIRQSFFFGYLNARYLKEGFETFGPFNHAGTMVEWRLNKDKVPVSAILRWVIENGDPKTGEGNSAYDGQVLVISKVAQKEDGIGCVAGYVDALANPDPNTLARKIADDIAPGFRCGIDEAAYHGKRGEKASGSRHQLPTAPRVK
ncbi:UNVERIFIED_ORG: hypothetical protein J2W85_003937 [Ensifer adhaerens]|nr:hypothetical protein [Ensifer adhaerens]